MSGTITFRLVAGAQSEPLSREALRRLYTWEEHDPGESGLVMSEHMRTLSSYLSRYCRGDIDGFSVLLAGQRGAGKTTLARKLIQDAIVESEHLLPLPIYLHGPTIIDKLASRSGKKDEAKEPDSSKGGAVTINIGAERRPAAPKPEKEEEDIYEAAREAKANGLPKLISALHTNFSDAICNAWRNAARYSGDRRRSEPEGLELAAHLDRLLDITPGVEPLRKLWQRGGFLQSGVVFHLRPRPAGGPAVPTIAGDQRNQGVREILALAALADAFRAVIGKTTETWRSNRSSEQRRQGGLPQMAAAEAKKDAEKKEEGKKEAGAKVGPTAIGAVAGLAALQGLGGDAKAVVPALLLGVVTWSVSWLAWNYAVARSSKQALERESTTEIDWTEIRVLERRFPQLIRRVKDAGFAPIFILDELDKLESKQINKLDEFLTLSKHIVADEAAFFFLVNRDYYERLERLDAGLPDIAPPRDGGKPTRPDRGSENTKQKTFFTDRVFVLYHPDDYRELFRKRASAVGVEPNSTVPEDEARFLLDAWATVLIYRSRLEMFWFRRAFFDLFPGNTFPHRRLPINPLDSPAERKAIVLQLAVEAMTWRSPVRSRIDHNPYYARLIYDTFYFVDRLQDSAYPRDDNGVITVKRSTLLEHLQSLANGYGNPYDLLSEDTLFGFLKDYLELLAHPRQLRDEVLSRARDLDPDVPGGSLATDRLAATTLRRLADAIELDGQLIELLQDVA